MAQIVFVNRFFAPDHSATSQILTDLATHLAERGESVTVVTSRQLYGDARAGLPESEVLRGVKVLRIATTRFGRAGLAGRSLDFLSFYVGAMLAVFRLVRKGDVVVAKTDPPLLSVALSVPARLRGAHLVNWLQDLYPEIAVELGVPIVRGWPSRFLSWLRDRSLQSAAANVVLGEQMALRLQAGNVPVEAISIICNWVDDEKLRPQTGANQLRRDWGLTGRLVVGYSGNLGRAHEYETVLGAAQILREEAVTFLFVGGGHHMAELRRRAEAAGLSGSFCFQPYQETNQLALSLGAADVHWVSLLPEMEGLIVPSKFYGILAVGRPVITVMDREGELASIVRRFGIGEAVAIGDAAGFASAIRTMAASPDRRIALGKQARAALEANFSRRASLDRWANLLASVKAAQPGRAVPDPGFVRPAPPPAASTPGAMAGRARGPLRQDISPAGEA